MYHILDYNPYKKLNNPIENFDFWIRVRDILWEKYEKSNVSKMQENRKKNLVFKNIENWIFTWEWIDKRVEFFNEIKSIEILEKGLIINEIRLTKDDLISINLYDEEKPDKDLDLIIRIFNSLPWNYSEKISFLYFALKINFSKLPWKQNFKSHLNLEEYKKDKKKKKK